MKKKLQLLDCTLRDGAYIVNADFGENLIKGLFKRLYASGIDIIECGWLKDTPGKRGSSFFHVPDDVLDYLPSEDKNGRSLCAMIDWDRYDLKQLPPCNNRSIDTIRVVFPHGKAREALKLARRVTEQGYRLFLQAANTLRYSDEELIELAEEVNASNALALSVVDTFGAMYPGDLDRIFNLLDKKLRPNIKIGFHSHNNMQLSFALSMRFAEYETGRDLILDSSLCGMGRGAGNATTELVASYLNRFFKSNYDMNEILDAIDTYIEPLKSNYSWGYSTPYFIAGTYCCHVNNIAYLLDNHRTLSKDIRLIIESLSPDSRLKYDYDLLEDKFISYSDRGINDEDALVAIKKLFLGRKLLLLAPGLTLKNSRDEINKFIDHENPLVVGINSLPEGYNCDYLFFSKPLRYQYAAEKDSGSFDAIPKILTSNVKTCGDADEMIVNYNLLVKQGWTYFDDSMIMFLRLLVKIGAKEIYLAGFDGFPLDENFAYADPFLQGNLSREKRMSLNDDIASMMSDILEETDGKLFIEFLTPSIYSEKVRTFHNLSVSGRCCAEMDAK